MDLYSQDNEEKEGEKPAERLRATELSLRPPSKEEECQAREGHAAALGSRPSSSEWQEPFVKRPWFILQGSVLPLMFCAL